MHDALTLVLALQFVLTLAVIALSTRLPRRIG
jgi:hypothetical protein